MRKVRALVLLLFSALAIGACAPGRPVASAEAEQAAKPRPEARAAGVIISPLGIVAPLLATFDGGYWVRTPCFNTVAVHGGRRVDYVDVVLDPGHGGPESGAVSPSGAAEKVPNLAVSRLVHDDLAGLGISSILTRPGDTSFLTLKTRAEIATALNPKAFVAIHHNAGTTERSEQPGTEAYHQIASGDGRHLAQLIYDDVFATFRRYEVRTPSGDRDGWVNPNPGVKSRRGEHGDYYGVLRMSSPVTSVIIEAAFMSNQPEADLLLTPTVQQAEADAITGGLVQWLVTERTGELLTEPNQPVDPATPAEDADGCVDPPLE